MERLDDDSQGDDRVVFWYARLPACGFEVLELDFLVTLLAVLVEYLGSDSLIVREDRLDGADAFQIRAYRELEVQDSR